MSYEAYEAVWQSSAAVSSARTTILAMANFASKTNRYTCSASVETLAGMVGVSTRQIQKNVNTLAELGEIRVVEGTGRGNYNVYDLKPLMAKHESQFTLSGQEEPEKGELQYVNGEVQFAHPDPERVNSGTERVNSSTEKGEPQFDRTINNQTEPKEPEEILIGGFQQKTALSPPHPSATAFQTKWRRPMSEILRLCGGDLEKAEAARDGALELLWSKSYHITSPKSILTTASNLINGARASPAANGNHDPLEERKKRIEERLKREGLA